MLIVWHMIVTPRHEAGWSEYGLEVWATAMCRSNWFVLLEKDNSNILMVERLLRTLRRTKNSDIVGLILGIPYELCHCIHADKVERHLHSENSKQTVRSLHATAKCLNRESIKTNA